jgi:hypothetical protein
MSTMLMRAETWIAQVVMHALLLAVRFWGLTKD